MYWDYNLFTNHVVNSWDIQVLESLPGVSATVYLLYLKNRLENEWLEPQSHGGCLEDEFHFQKKNVRFRFHLNFLGWYTLED